METQKLRAYLVDDELLAIERLKRLLAPFPQIEIAGTSSDPVKAIEQLEKNPVDVLFLDIQMPSINGFELLSRLKVQPFVIFTTAFDEYAIKAFESHAVDYLLKPFNKERFDKAVRKWLDQHGNSLAHKTGAASTGGPASADTDSDPTGALLETAAQSPAQQQRIVVKTGGKIKIIPLEDIHYLEAADDYVKIHTHNGAFLKNRTMSYFERALDGSQFVRTHRSYILNVQQVTRIDPYEKDSHLCILQSGAQVPVSKAGYVKLKTVLGL